MSLGIVTKSSQTWSSRSLRRGDADARITRPGRTWPVVRTAGSAATERHHVTVVGRGGVVEVVEVAVREHHPDRAVGVTAPDPLATGHDAERRIELGEQVV